MACRIVPSLALCAALFAAVPAAAQDTPPEETPADPFSNDDLRQQEARTLFEAGRLAFTDGRFADALASFQRSYDLSHRPLLLFNIGACLDRLQRHGEAIEAFEQYLREMPEAANRLEVEARIREMRDAAERERENAERLRRQEEERRLLEAQLAEEQEPVTKKWWFWTIMVAAVAGGITALGFALYDPGVEDPLVGSTGQVSTTLRMW